MTTTDWKKLKKDAADTMQSINTGKLTKDSYILFGASLAILDHEEPEAINMPVMQEKPVQAIVAHHIPKSLRELVENELSDSEMYAGMNEFDIARDELRHADRFLNVLKSKGDIGNLQELINRREAISARL